MVVLPKISYSVHLDSHQALALTAAAPEPPMSEVSLAEPTHQRSHAFSSSSSRIPSASTDKWEGKWQRR